MEAQVSLTVASISSAFFGLLFLIVLLTISHRLSMGFRSGEFAGQSSTPTPWSFNQLLVLLAVWAGGNKRSPYQVLSTYRVKKELEVPELFSNLISLQILLLTENKLESLPSAIFHDTSRLEILDLNHNHLRYLPGDIFVHVSALKDLFLSGNKWNCDYGYCRMDS